MREKPSFSTQGIDIISQERLPERAPMRWKFLRGALLACAVIVLPLLPGCKGEAHAPEIKEEPAGRSVRVFKVSQGTMQPTIGFTGAIVPVHEVEVYSKIPGKVREVLVKEGDKVSEGQLLVQLEDDELQAQMRSVEANLAMARTNLSKARTGYELQDSQVSVGINQALQGKIQAQFNSEQIKLNMENARIDRDRMRRLFDRGAISKQQLEINELKYNTNKKQYETALSLIKNAEESVRLAHANSAQKMMRSDEIEGAKAQIEALAASLDLARINVENCRIKAPISGYITFKGTETGEIVNAMSTGKPLVRIVDNSRVNFEGEVGEEKIEQIKDGDKVQVFLDALPGKSFIGSVETVIAAADLKTKSFRVKVAIPNESGTIKSGMFGRASVLLPTVTGMLIPRNALLEASGQKAEKAPEEGIPTVTIGKSTGIKPYMVYIAHGKLAKRRSVTIGAMNEKQAVITDGLSSGDEVIVTGQDALEENIPILVVRG
ncbi:MAG: efflux RND transporter periplasmic adaptor subunit [Candidatus Eremiobacteraeota bacterium]|nr:efflux RND transporter periplasmic adaptor subunit [Candidatus Eremiobacteraeota bacterium]